MVYGQTSKEVLVELIRQQIPNPDIVLAQAILETGNFKSPLCKKYHNLFGIRHKGRYVHYRSWKESIKDYGRCISSRYNGGDYYAFLKRIEYSKDPMYIRKLKQFR